MARLHGAVGLAAAMIAAGAWAEEPPNPQADFTFKRITVGKGAPQPKVVTKRITVQIDPEEQARFLAALPKIDPSAAREAAEAGEAPPTPKSAYGWYWEQFSPGRDGAGPGRLDAAERALAMGPDGARVRAPRLATLQTIAETHNAAILKATVGTNVSPALVLAVIGIESGGRPQAVSSAGATGLMQLMPGTAERFGVSDRTDPGQNITGGVKYLDWLLKEFNGDPVLALAGYNAGEGAVAKHDGVPPYAETRDYVPKVLAAWQVARNLCVTPPQLVSDGCVFRPRAKQESKG